ncbi:thioredoxin [Paramecium bursaria Chlorella virus KS1B]|nr:thioredoxin [Paramecium bursaria Chlorella virus KS1B]
MIITITMNIIKINTSHQLTQRIMTSTRPSVIQFTGKNCNPCKLFKKKITETSIPVEVFDVDFYENKQIGKLFNVSVLPTAIFIDEQQPVARMNGLKEYDEFIELVEPVVNDDCVVVHWE